MSTRYLVTPLFAILAACATVPLDEQSQPVSSSAASNLSLEPFNPSAFAAEFATPLDCERGARRLHSSSGNDAWRALKACVAKGNFPRLDELADPAWAQDLRTRPDAPKLLCRVIAMQGGSIHRDLQLLHELRVPLFSLEDGVSAPEVYSGQNIVLRGRVNEVRTGHGNITAKVEEVAVESAAFDAPIGYGLRTRTETRGGRGALSWSSDSTLHRTIRRYVQHLEGNRARGTATAFSAGSFPRARPRVHHSCEI